MQGLSEAEFEQWCLRGKPLWPRRMEILLLQLTAMVGWCNGNKDLRMGDLDPFKQQDAETEAAVQFMAEASGAGIRRLGQGRKGR